MDKIVGAQVWATETGLGRLAKLLYDSGIIDKVQIKDKRDGKVISPEWYRSEDVIEDDTAFLRAIDTLLIVEVPLPDAHDWRLVIQAKSLGKKIVLMPMYECTPTSRRVSDLVDEIICPSLLDLEYYKHENASFITVPSDSTVKWKERKIAHTFLHNAGHGGVNGRNGTEELIRAIPLIKSEDIEIIIRAQPGCWPDLQKSIMKGSRKLSNVKPTVSVEQKNFSHDELWKRGDVFVFPEKFNGLSMPIQEAYAAGMAIMCTNRFPMNTWLPQECMIPVHSFTDTHVHSCSSLSSANVRPLDIAKTIDRWANADISHLSRSGKEWAENHSAQALLPQYNKALRSGGRSGISLNREALLHFQSIRPPKPKGL